MTYGYKLFPVFQVRFKPLIHYTSNAIMLKFLQQNIVIKVFMKRLKIFSEIVLIL